MKRSSRLIPCSFCSVFSAAPTRSSLDHGFSHAASTTWERDDEAPVVFRLACFGTPMSIYMKQAHARYGPVSIARKPCRTALTTSAVVRSFFLDTPTFVSHSPPKRVAVPRTRQFRIRFWLWPCWSLWIVDGQRIGIQHSPGDIIGTPRMPAMCGCVSARGG